MRKGWEIKMLAEVCDFQNGFAFKSNSFKPKGSPVLRISNIQNNAIDFENLVYIDAADYKEDLSKYEVHSGDLLIAMSGGTTGKIGINNTDTVFYLNQRVGMFHPKKTLIKPLLYYFLSTKVEENLRISAGSAQPNLSTEQIKSFEIPLPPLPEQHRIVSILDEAFEAIDQAKANTEKNLQNARELFQSELNSIFTNKGEGWVERRLKDVGETQTGNTPKTSEQDNYGCFIPFVKPAHFRPDGTITSGDSGLSEKGLKSARLFNANSILMVCIGATIGKTGFSERPVTSNQQINALTPKQEYEPRFFYYALTTDIFFKKVIHGSSQATLPIINKSKWENLTVPIPKDKGEQVRIVNQLDTLSVETKQLEENYRKKLERLEELKKSILQKAFSGELTRQTTEIQMEQLDLVAEDQSNYHPNR